ncbi:MAG TPA: 16S rRNA (cytidine(1402)-2'-O)-methyltransferase [Acidimicrobiales bacterium]|nr:16S rRNA (cytidine(1402)-2'-O)-methyltransferase [Acidimicrobiales bacterium]
MSGRLVVIATPIGNLSDLSPRAAAALGAADVVACEDTRHSRKLFTALGIPAPSLMSVHKDNEVERCREVLALIADGRTVALVTDAGTPAVSDPGRLVVEAVAEAGVVVESIPGPSAVTTALAASGFSADRFVFEGFLPRKGKDRRARLEAIAAETRTVVLYEAPSRVAQTLRDLADACGDERAVVVGRELTKLHEEYWRGSLALVAGRAALEAAKGEFVVVVEGSSAEPPQIGDDVIVAALRDAITAGASTRQAADDVAALLSVKRNRVYKLAVELRPTS